MSENKIGKPALPVGRYLKYAIGEIILVVIGILIALKINTWNTNRIIKNEEHQLINKLHTDFKENKKELRTFLEEMRNKRKSQSVLISLIGASEQELQRHNLDSLFYVSFGASEVAFADNTIKNMIQSGKLNLLKREQLTELLYRWNTLSEVRTRRMRKTDDWTNSQFIPYLIDKISFKEMDMYSGYTFTGKSKVKPDYYPLFQEVAFENYLDNNLWFNQQVIDRCEETDQLIDEIIEATTPQEH